MYNIGKNHRAKEYQQKVQKVVGDIKGNTKNSHITAQCENENCVGKVELKR